jgi:hypothetical protein
MTGISSARGSISTRFWPGIKTFLGIRTRTGSRWFLTALALALLAVVLGLSQSTDVESPHWAKVWGGPTEGPAPLSLRVAVLEQELGPERGHTAKSSTRTATLSVRYASGARSTAALKFDADGVAFVTLQSQVAHPFISIETAGAVLAAGSIHLDRASYAELRRSRGGILRGKVDGPLQMTVAIADGVLAMGIPGELAISVLDPRGAPLACQLAVHFDGLETPAQASNVRASTDATGRVRLAVVPVDLAASIEVMANTCSNAHAVPARNASPTNRVIPSKHDEESPKAQLAPSTRFFASVPIETKSMQARYADGRITVISRIPVTRSYFALVNAEGRWDAGGIDMHCSDAAGCQGETGTNARPAGPTWVMLGTEPSLDGPNVVGWPTGDQVAIAQESVTYPEQLLLDGRSAALQRNAEARTKRFAVFMVGLFIAIATLVLAIALPLWQERGNMERLRMELPDRRLRRRIYAGGLAGPWFTAAWLALLVGMALLSLAWWTRWKLLGRL